MTKKESVLILKDHNQWRRAQGRYADISARPAYTAKQVGEAIDYVIAILTTTDSDTERKD